NTAKIHKIFSESELLIATNCEDERIIRQNLERLKAEKKELTAADHPLIRDEEACYQSSLSAIQIAKKYDSRLHVLHISTEKELELFSNLMITQKKITTEVCVHHLHYNINYYKCLGTQF